MSRDYDPNFRSRVGTFSLPAHALSQPDGLQAIFYGMVVLHAAEDFARREIRYFACHEQFAITAQGEHIPEYICTFPSDGVMPIWSKRA